jgi:hypothetical protein
MNTETTKSKAKALKSFLRSHGIKLKHSLALEAIARTEGVSSYNTLQAKQVKAQASRPLLRPIGEWPFAPPDVSIAMRYATLKNSAEHLWLIEQGYQINWSNGKFHLTDPKAAKAGYRLDRQEFDALITEAHAFLTQRPGMTGTALPSWDINVWRIGYGHTILRVKGVATRKQAEALALDEAGDLSMSEHTSEYEIEGSGSQAPDEIIDAADTSVDEDSTELRDWDVEICRMSYGTNTITIAGVLTREVAEAFALDQAGDYHFPQQSRSYKVIGSRVATDPRFHK